MTHSSPPIHSSSHLICDDSLSPTPVFCLRTPATWHGKTCLHLFILLYLLFPYIPLPVCCLCFLFMTVDAHTDHPLQPPDPPTFTINHPPMTPIRSPTSLYTTCPNSSTKASSRLTSSCARKTVTKGSGGSVAGLWRRYEEALGENMGAEMVFPLLLPFLLEDNEQGKQARERERRCRRSHCCCIRRHRRTGSTSSCQFLGHIPTWRSRARSVECRPRAWRSIECRRSSGEEFLTLDGCHKDLEGEERGVIFQG